MIRNQSMNVKRLLSALLVCLFGILTWANCGQTAHACCTQPDKTVVQTVLETSSPCHTTVGKTTQSSQPDQTQATCCIEKDTTAATAKTLSISTDFEPDIVLTPLLTVALAPQIIASANSLQHQIYHPPDTKRYLRLRKLLN